MSLVLMDHYSPTGEDLEKALEERLGVEGSQTFPLKVNWTGSRQLGEGILNAHSRTDKLAQLIRLTMVGVRVPEFSIQRPLGAGWLGRTLLHERGGDFKKPVAEPNFWTKFTPVDEEWRLHFFKTKKGNLRLLRSALKVPKEGASPLFRNHTFGWKLSYCGGAPEPLVAEGRKALSALLLDFGAVDGGMTPQGLPLIYEVNTCPGLETGTLGKYVESILERGGR